MSTVTVQYTTALSSSVARLLASLLQDTARGTPESLDSTVTGITDLWLLVSLLHDTTRGTTESSDSTVTGQFTARRCARLEMVYDAEIRSSDCV
jgi:hypothetical protein